MGSLSEVLAGPVGESGFGGVLGLAVGYAAKKATKLAALVIGAAFILVQGLSYLGWIEINWGVVQQTAEGVWEDPAGVTLADHAWAVLSANLPFGGGFAVGFAAGFKLG